MEKKQALQVIKDISNCNGASGFEDEVLLAIRKHIDGLGDITEDSLRNLYINRKENSGDKPRIQLDAHTDEVSFMVKCIRPNGTLDILPLGGWVTSNIPAHRFLVRTKTGKYIVGITASKPPHFLSAAQKNASLDISDITLDVGATSKEDAIENFGIRIGEPVVPEVEFEYDKKHDLMIGKSFDCRAGCACIVETLTELAGKNLDVDVIGAFSSQEEVGVRGAKLTCQTVKPDIAIVFEGCPADDTVVEGYASQTGIKKGPMLRHIDGRMITNPRFQRFALDLAEKLNIPVQEAVRASGSTNGAEIHLSNKGVPTIVIGIPVRYAHTHYGISAYSDYENAVKLAVEIITRLNKELIESF